jgi:ketosteroid isomerase-like protein
MAASRALNAPMNHITLNSLVTLCLMAMNGASLSTAASMDRNHAAISERAQALSAAVEAGDPAGAARCFTREAKLGTSGPRGVISGRAAIESFLQSAIRDGVKGLELIPTELEGSGELRVETGTYRVLGDSRAEIMRGEYMIAWKKEEGEWRIHRDFTTASAARPMTGPGEADRVGFPAGYLSSLELLSVTARADGSEIMTTFANSLASSAIKSGKVPYPDGAVILMEFALPSRDGEGQVLRDSSGKPVKGEIAHIDVMRRGEGFGAAYGDNRAGNWEFASYARDGKTLIAPASAGHCAACHQRAGAAKDYVFRSSGIATRF